MLTLGIDLSTLTPGELARLLQSARERGEVVLAERLQHELTARRHGPARSRTPWTAAEVVQPAIVETPQDGPARRAAPLALALAAAAAVSAGAGWWLTRTPAPPAPVPAPAPVLAAATPAVLPVAVAPPPAEPVTPKAPVARAHRVQHAAVAPARRNGPLDCSLAKARADRMVCADRGLSAQHRAMRAAYDRAIAAGADRLRLDRGQAKWRQRRAQADDRRELADLYAERIAALRAAARR